MQVVVTSLFEFKYCYTGPTVTFFYAGRCYTSYYQSRCPFISLTCSKWANKSHFFKEQNIYYTIVKSHRELTYRAGASTKHEYKTALLVKQLNNGSTTFYQKQFFIILGYFESSTAESNDFKCLQGKEGACVVGGDDACPSGRTCIPVNPDSKEGTCCVGVRHGVKTLSGRSNSLYKYNRHITVSLI